ncbi:MAG: transposase domain-containing protein [Clostridia bacterium]|nr:transposase domain-containing protein [Clostridia bacterium]
MKIDRKPDKKVPHHPVQCQGCPYAGQCQYKVSGTRYEYEVIVKTELIAHQVLSCTSCKMTGRRDEGKFPAHINGAKQYGAGVSALTTVLLTVGYMSVDRVQKLLNSLGIFTLLETAKANGLNPESYLNHLLTVLPERFAADPLAVTDDLMPWNLELQRALMPECSGAEH